MERDERPYIEPFSGPLDAFPKDEELPEGAEIVCFRDRPGLRPAIHANVVYDRQGDTDLHLQILVPQGAAPGTERFPLLVFIPGSAWKKQSVFQVLPNMLRMCEKGYTVAVVEYRHTGLAAFPAQAEDAKTAIRFMKLHAAEYHADPERTAVWGDSSGAHTALMAGFTGDEYPDNGRYRECSASVRCVVDWYGPTDIIGMNSFPSTMDHTEPESPEGRLIGFRNVRENPALARQASPISYLRADKETPPLLIMHGNRDELVCYRQSVELYRRMRELGKNVRMVCLDGAYHGFGGFRSDEALDMVDAFLREYL